MATERDTGKEKSSLLEIHNPTQRVIARALKTLPVSPIYGSISLSCDGNPNSDTYVKQCVEKGVIPSSYVTLKYESDVEAFEPDGRGEFGWSDGLNSTERDLVVESFLRGNRIGNVEFEMTWKADRGYEIFRSKWLKRIPRSGFRIREVDLWFTALLDGERYNAGGQRSEDALSYRDKTLKLLTGRKLPQDKTNELRRWFVNLGPEVTQFQPRLGSVAATT